MSDEVKFRGSITEKTPGGGIWFLISEGPHAGREECFPGSLCAVVELAHGQEITVPARIAEEKDLW